MVEAGMVVGASYPDGTSWVVRIDGTQDGNVTVYVVCSGEPVG
jgi:hypothetical protein